MAVLTIFAGPNGSGKSSLIQQIEFEGRRNLLDSDAVARRMNEDQPRSSGIAAGREVLRRSAEYIRNEDSFAIETTLAGKWTDAAIRSAQEARFFVRLVYVCLDNPERSIQRVRERVARGGHDVPDSDVRRRYWRSLANAGRVLRAVQQAVVFDNSGAEPRWLFEIRDGEILNQSGEMTAWAVTLLA